MRAGEFIDPQPAPVTRPGGVSMHYVAAALHRLRGDHGLRKYGSLLQAQNGRDADVDRVQESLDGLVYELQRTVEARALADALAEFRGWLAESEGRAALVDSTVVLDEFDRLTGREALAERADGIAIAMIEGVRDGEQ